MPDRNCLICKEFFGSWNSKSERFCAIGSKKCTYFHLRSIVVMHIRRAFRFDPSGIDDILKHDYGYFFAARANVLDKRSLRSSNARGHFKISQPRCNKDDWKDLWERNLRSPC
jgi:hypothetical protein